MEPHIHCVNAAEQAIQTFKDAFIAALATTDRDFPLQLWDRLAPQVQDTKNLIRASRIKHPLPIFVEPILYDRLAYNAHRDVNYIPNNVSIANVFSFCTFTDKVSGVVYNDLTGKFPFLSIDCSV